MCNAKNHHPDCRCGWGGEGHLGKRSAGEGVRSLWRYHDEKICYKTRCKQCNGEVFFVRHNGGSVWLDKLGLPWPKHGCYYKEQRLIPSFACERFAHLLKKPKVGIVTEIAYYADRKYYEIVIRRENRAIERFYTPYRLDLDFLLGEVVLFSVGEERIVHPGLPGNFIAASKQYVVWSDSEVAKYGTVTCRIPPPPDRASIPQDPNVVKRTWRSDSPYDLCREELTSDGRLTSIIGWTRLEYGLANPDSYKGITLVFISTTKKCVVTTLFETFDDFKIGNGFVVAQQYFQNKFDLSETPIILMFQDGNYVVHWGRVGLGLSNPELFETYWLSNEN